MRMRGRHGEGEYGDRGRGHGEEEYGDASVKTSVSEARLRWLTELIFQIGHSVGILECQRRPPGLQMLPHFAGLPI